MRIGVCDDEQLYLKQVAAFCERYGNESGKNYIVSVFQRGEKIMRHNGCILILMTVLTIFCLCSCEGKQQVQKEKETKEVIYYEVAQDGVQTENSYRMLYISTPDFEPLTEDENEYIKGIDGVIDTEYYGGAARTKYYYQFEKDYTFVESLYGSQIFRPVDRESQEHFMRSAGKLTQQDLAEGRLPKAKNEIVLYTSDKSMLGKTVEIYFYCNDLYLNNPYVISDGGAENSYVEKEMVITGILSEKTEQIYFEDSFCDMMGKMATEFDLKHVYVYLYETDDNNGVVSVKDKIGPAGSIRLESDDNSMGSVYKALHWNGEYESTIMLNKGRTETRIVYVDETLGKCEVSLAKIYLEHMDGVTKEENKDDSLSYGMYDFLELSYRMPEDWVFAEKKEGEIWSEDALSLIGYGGFGDVEMSYSEAKPKSHTVVEGIRDFSSKSGASTLAVSQELFDAMHPYEGSKVIAVYIEDGKEEKVKTELLEQGYVEYQLQTYYQEEE